MLLCFAPGFASTLTEIWPSLVKEIADSITPASCLFFSRVCSVLRVTFPLLGIILALVRRPATIFFVMRRWRSRISQRLMIDRPAKGKFQRKTSKQLLLRTNQKFRENIRAEKKSAVVSISISKKSGWRERNAKPITR